MFSCVATFAAALGMVTASTSAPQWQSSYGTALEQTRSDDRPLLVVIDKPSEEGKHVGSDLLTGQDVAGLLKPYDLCRVDASTEYGKKVAAAFKTQSFPYLAFVDKSGSVILHSHTGSVSEKQWSELLTKYQTGQRPVKHTVAKPVTSSSSYPTSKPYCAKCQRGY